jgi:hypothetical protein
VALDLADTRCYSDTPTETVTPVLALYENGKLKGLTMQEDVRLNDGIAETSLSTQINGTATEYKVFVMQDSASVVPLCGMVKGSLQ